MFKTINHTLFCLLIFYYASSANAVIPIAERNALIALYNSTQGAKWVKNNGWKGAVGTECQWQGVSCLNNNQVSILSLDENNLKGIIPQELGQLSKLKSLSLGTNQLSGTIPKALMQLSQLKTLDLRKNQLSGTIPAELGQLSQLDWLSLHRNQLTGTIPKELGQLSLLKVLFLGGNKLKGTIPKPLFQLNKLKTLDLRDNQLSGFVPKELRQLVNLTTLILDHNQFSGTIPSELGQLNQLEWLYLGQNLLSGTIPKELAKISHLKRLFLGNNQLTGSIPNELGQLRLRYLFLHGNRLSGTIPKELGLSGSLEFLKLDGNLLSGTIPKELRGLKELSIFSNCLSLLDDESTIDILNNLDIGNQDMCESFSKQKNIPVVFTYPNAFHSIFWIDIPLISVSGKSYKVSLSPYKNPLDTQGFYWKLNSLDVVKNVTLEQSNNPVVTYNPQTAELNFNQIALRNQLITAKLKAYKNPGDAKGTYFRYVP
ncbi:MAG: hypothetical protein KAH20_09470 [Methylococcales bacterium]|nr:hypothetical protein [Methylococcales bacterium]